MLTDGRARMIERVWRGWTTRDNAEAYERLLRDEIFPGIAARGVPGYTGIRLLRRQLSSGEMEFMTIMSFDSVDAVRAFAGGDYERAYVPQAAREVLLRFDQTSAHYEVLDRRTYPEP
jgi:antibiotic biosynthesis monooxygenase (ABM) superfamily enzyme